MLLKRVRAIFEKDAGARVTLHAIGAAIPKAVDLALELQRCFSQTLVICPFTFTIPLVDEWLPKDPLSALPPRSVSRLNSAIRLLLFSSVGREGAPAKTDLKREKAAAAPTKK